MPRRLKRLLVLTLALIAFVVLFPVLTTAAPHQGDDFRAPAAHHEATPSLFAQLRSRLAALWETGSGLEPNGDRPGAPNATTSGDTGSGLEPDGRH